jgi:gluconokinase
MECVITIEIGTSAAKVVAFDYQGNEIVYKKGSYPTFHPQPDFSEQDPEQVFITVLFVLKSILNDPAFNKKYVVTSICLSSAMHSVLPVDNKGVPLGNAIIWADNRADEIANELKNSSIGKQIYQNTGTPIHAMSPLAKITWIKRQDPKRFEKTSRFISLKEYFIFQLTGEYMIDYSLASATGFFNFNTLAWEEESLKFAGVDKSYFSTPVPIFDSSLKIKDTFIKSLRLLPNTRLIIGSTDGCLATLSSGVLNDRQATISITSSGAVRTVGKECLTDEKGQFFNYLLDKNFFISGGPTNNGGVAFEWATRLLGYVDVTNEFESSFNKILNEVSKVKPGSEGVLFLPYLLGERSPIWNSDARGMFFGLNITHEPKHLIRATIEGIIFEILSIGNAIRKYRSFDYLHVTGSYATHPFWAQLISDIFGMTVSVSNYRQSSNLGAAMVALTSIGVYDNLESAGDLVIKGIDLHPSMDDNKIYDKYHRIFESLTQKLGDEFHEISKLQNND